MGPRRLRPLALTISLILCAAITQAQQKSNNENPQQTDGAVRDKALKLLYAVASQLDTLQSGENRARFGSNLVASIWPHDEKRARELFTAVEAEIREGLNKPPSNHPDDARTLAVFVRLRKDTAERVGKLDPSLALDFLRRTPVANDDSLSYNGGGTSEYELKLARQVAAKDPDVALEVGRKSIERGIYDDVLMLLWKLLVKHNAHGRILYKDMVLKLQSANVVDNWNLFGPVSQLIQLFQPPLVDEATYQQLIHNVLDAAVAIGCTKETSNLDTHWVCQPLGGVLPQLQKSDPVRGAQLSKFRGENEQSIDDMPSLEDVEILEEGGVDEMLALVAKYPSRQGEIFIAAFQKAQAAGDYSRARKIAANYPGDVEVRRNLLEMTGELQSAPADAEIQIADVQARAETMPLPVARASYLSSTAMRLAAKDRATAIKLLNQASEVVATLKPGEEQMGAEIRLALAYSAAKSDRAFTIMESVVPKLNDLINSAAKLDGYDTRYLRDGEWNMSAEGGLGRLLEGLANSAHYFAVFDFDRAVNLAGQFERHEIRLMAQLKLAQSVLDKRPDLRVPVLRQ